MNKDDYDKFAKESGIKCYIILKKILLKDILAPLDEDQNKC